MIKKLPEVLNFDTKVKDLFPVRYRVGHKVGIELEYENVALHKIHMSSVPGWRADIDHSLRTSGIEFISQPFPASALFNKLHLLEPALVKTEAKVTKRCGLHVHVNCTHYTLHDLWKVITLYALMEPFIFREFADGREDSHFCVPLWANTSLQTKLYEDAVALYRGKLLGGQVMSGVGNAFITDTPPTTQGILHAGAGGTPKRSKYGLKMLLNAKYSAMNFTSLIKFGTVEYRQARSTLDMQEVERWAKFLVNLHTVAQEFKTLDDIINEFYDEGPSALCKKLDLKQYPDMNAEFIEDAEDAAILCVGHPPTDHRQLKWEIS